MNREKFAFYCYLISFGLACFELGMVVPEFCHSLKLRKELKASEKRIKEWEKVIAKYEAELAVEEAMLKAMDQES